MRTDHVHVTDVRLRRVDLFVCAVVTTHIVCAHTHTTNHSHTITYMYMQSFTDGIYCFKRSLWYAELSMRLIDWPFLLRLNSCLIHTTAASYVADAAAAAAAAAAVAATAIENPRNVQSSSSSAPPLLPPISDS